MKNLKDKKALKIVVVLSTLLINYWTWRIIFFDPILLIILSLLTLFLYRIFLGSSSSLKLAVLLFVIAAVLNLRSGFDITFKATTREIKLNQRHNYYYEYFGKLYANKVSTYVYNNVLPTWYKFEKNVFSSLDLNLYFFNSHPRERAEVEEFKKYPFLFLPFFLIGFIFLITKKTKIVLGYLAVAALINGFIAPNYKLGPILFFPIINMFIALGIIVAFPKVARLFKFKIK